MSLVIGRGPSVHEYAGNKLKKCCAQNFTFGVNDAAFDYPCDMVVACDYQWILDNRSKLLKLGKPVITREWDVVKDIGLEMVMLPNEIVQYARLSGMVAAKISDGFSARIGIHSFVVGLDHTDKHYDMRETDSVPISKVCEVDSYQALGCTNTVNLGLQSAITAWPKSVRLPFEDKPSHIDKDWGAAFIKTFATKLMMEGINA